MKAHVSDLVSRLELLAVDHEPNGWPAVQMRDLTMAAKALRDQEAEIARMEKVTRLFAEAVRREAFKMPPPNEWTPIFVMLANEADYRITAHLGAEQ